MNIEDLLLEIKLLHLCTFKTPILRQVIFSFRVLFDGFFTYFSVLLYAPLNIFSYFSFGIYNLFYIFF